MNKKPDTVADFAEKFIKQQEKEFDKALNDPSTADLLLNSPETVALFNVSSVLKGILLVQANIADRLLDIEKLLIKEV